MNYLLSIPCALMVLALSACAQVAPDKAAKIPIYRDGDSGPSAQEIARLDRLNEELFPNGGIAQLKKGDRIFLRFAVDGDMFTTEPGFELPLTIEQDMWVLGSDTGVSVSFDGETFKRLGKVVDGSLDLRLDYREAENKNALKLSLTTNRER